MTTTTYSVPTMHCSSCVMLLEGLEDEVEGVEGVQASLKRLEVTVTYDESKVSEEVIIEEARKEGYELLPRTN